MLLLPAEAGVELLLSVDAGVLFTVPVDTLRLVLPWVAAGVDSLLRSVDAGLASPLFGTEVVALRLSPPCAAAGLPDALRVSPFCTAVGLPADLLPVAAELLLSLPDAAAGADPLLRLALVLA